MLNRKKNVLDIISIIKCKICKVVVRMIDALV